MPHQDLILSAQVTGHEKHSPVTVQHARILLACQDTAQAEMARTRLTLAGYEVEVAKTAADALSEAHQQPPDLALLVAPLLDADGADISFDTARRLKAEADAAYLPVMVALPLADESAQAMEGADDLLPLPLAPGLLLQRIRALLHFKRLYQALSDSAQETTETCEEAQHAAARYQAVFEQSPSAMLLVSSDEGRILQANACALALSGYTAQDLTGQSLGRLSPPDSDQWADEVTRWNGIVPFVREETFLLTGSGEQIPVKVQGAPAQTHIEPTQVVTLTDLRPEIARRQVAGQAAAAEMANAFSREINSPLFVISSNAEMLQSALLDQDSALRAKLGRIADASRRIALATGRLSPPASDSE